VFGPLKIPFDFGARLSDEMGKSADEFVTAMGNHLIGELTEHPLAGGVKETYNDLFGAEGSFKRATARQIGNLVPLGVTKAAPLVNKAADAMGYNVGPALERRGGDAGKDFVGGAIDEVKSRIPVVREKLPARFTALGDVNELPTYGAFDPFRMKEERQSPVLSRIDKYDIPLNEATRKPGESDAAFATRARETGQNLKRNLDILTRSPVFTGASPEDRKSLATATDRFSRKPDNEGMLHRIDPYQLREALENSKLKKKMTAGNRKTLRVAAF
jgi:hypothetical protein